MFFTTNINTFRYKENIFLYIKRHELFDINQIIRAFNIKYLVLEAFHTLIEIPVLLSFILL